jgi:glycosyltransferase involved in cell wall biosynthesis
MPSVLHIGSIAGVPQELSKAQRRLGQKSDVISFQPHPFHYDVDFYRPTKLPFPLRYLERLYYMFHIVRDYDILHFHYFSLFPFGWDLPIWKALGKRIIMHHHGDDIRNKGEGWLYSRFADRILVSTPDLLAWSHLAIWIPNPIDLKNYEFIGVQEHAGAIRILHAPSARSAKGTEHVLRAIDDLQKDGYKVKLILVENMSHYDALELYRGADIVVDQLLVGWFGVFAIECMALGKPVMVHIRDELRSYLQNAPLFDTTPQKLNDDLKKLIGDASLRADLGARARSFVEQNHNADKIVKYINDYIYK